MSSKPEKVRVRKCGYCGEPLVDGEPDFRCQRCQEGPYCEACAEADGHFKAASGKQYLCDECAAEEPDSDPDDSDDN